MERGLPLFFLGLRDLEGGDGLTEDRLYLGEARIFWRGHVSGRGLGDGGRWEARRLALLGRGRRRMDSPGELSQLLGVGGIGKPPGAGVLEELS